MSQLTAARRPEGAKILYEMRRSAGDDRGPVDRYGTAWVGPVDVDQLTRSFDEPAWWWTS